jgi:hypothetical protein
MAERADNSAVIARRGWLDSETCDHVQALMDAALDDRAERLRLDLSSLIGLDESGRPVCAGSVGGAKRRAPCWRSMPIGRTARQSVDDNNGTPKPTRTGGAMV